VTETSVTEEIPPRVLVVLAHPDDPEFFCGGTVARWTYEGWSVTYCLLTKGERGNDHTGTDLETLALQRMEEQRKAASVLGVQDIIFLDHPDGYLTPDLLLRKDVVRVIRKVKPEIVITCDPTNFFPSNRYINHPDHRAAGQATLDAVFPAAGSGLFFPELNDEEGMAPHKVSQVFVAGAQHPNMVVEVTDFIDRKIEALREHESQIADIEEVEQRLRKNMLDEESSPEAPHYIEKFKRIDLQR
jgi:LmbE family N-acetylglucosaminyl deacetylase